MPKLFYVLQGVGAGFFFGTASIFVRFLAGVDAFTIVVFRVLVAGLLLSVLAAFFFRSDVVNTFRKFPREIPLLGFLLSFHFIFFVLGVQNTSVVNATTLVNTTPAMALAIGWGLGWTKPTNVNVIGLVLAVAGSATMALGESSGVSGGLLGNVYAVLGAFFWALYLVVGKRVRQEVNIFAVFGPLLLFTSLPALAAAYLLGRGLYPLNPAQTLFLLALALFPTVLGHGLQFSSLRGLHPYQASSLALLEPIVAALLAAVLLAEVAGPVTYLGAAAVILGIYLVIR